MGWVSVSRQEKTQLKVRNSPLNPHHTTPHHTTPHHITSQHLFLPPPGAADGVKGTWRCGQCVNCYKGLCAWMCVWVWVWVCGGVSVEVVYACIPRGASL